MPGAFDAPEVVSGTGPVYLSTEQPKRVSDFDKQLIPTDGEVEPDKPIEEGEEEPDKPLEEGEEEAPESTEEDKEE